MTQAVQSPETTSETAQPARPAAPKRTAIVLEPEIQDKVASLAKNFKLSQGVVIDTMLELLAGKPEFEAALKAKREDKVGSRTGKTAILKRLSKLSAEELEELAKSLKEAQ